jgi:two-component sensor histidine kinase
MRVDIADDVRLSVDTAIPCGLIVNELVSNALKHAFPPGWKTPGLITIAMRQTPHGYALRVEDNGVGMPADVDLRRAHSLGLELVAILAQQLGGAVDIDRQGGTAFTITFARNG